MLHREPTQAFQASPHSRRRLIPCPPQLSRPPQFSPPALYSSHPVLPAFQAVQLFPAQRRQILLLMAPHLLPSRYQMVDLVPAARPLPVKARRQHSLQVLVIGGQMTFPTIKPYTEYVVQIITVCAAAPGSCTVLTETSTISGYRTQLSCSPGVCTGAMINNQVDAAFTAATCVVTA